VNDGVSLITEIFQGYTELTFDGGSVFLRHITLKDQGLLSSLTSKFLAAKKAIGIISEDEKLAELEKDKMWTSEDDLKVSELKNSVDNLLLSKKKYAIPSQQKEIQKLIDEESGKLNSLLSKKRELIGLTAEDCATKAANEEYIRHLFYADETLKTLRFTDEEFGAISREELSSFYEEYHRLMIRFSDENIQKIVLEDFFGLYLSFCERPMDFYGRPLIGLSIFQQKLLYYGRVFFNIFQNTEKIPDEIRKDPKAILDYVDSSRSKEKLKARNKDSQAAFVMGTREDAEQLSDGREVGNLSEELKANNGYMDQQQIFKKFGIQTG
jgi:hypothetical protein